MSRYAEQKINQFREIVELAIKELYSHDQAQPNGLVNASTYTRASFGLFTYERSSEDRWSLTAHRQYCGDYAGSLVIASTLGEDESLQREWHVDMSRYLLGPYISREIRGIGELADCVEVAEQPHLNLSKLRQIGQPTSVELELLADGAAAMKEANAEPQEEFMLIDLAERRADRTHYLH